jgi:hypothetical protein
MKGQYTDIIVFYTLAFFISSSIIGNSHVVPAVPLIVHSSQPVLPGNLAEKHD